MSLWEVVETSGPDEAVIKQVQGFFADLGAGRFLAARDRAADGFSWFGTAIKPTAWTGAAIRDFISRHGLSAANVRVLAPQLVEAIPPVVRYGAFGELQPDERVLLIDVTRAGRTATALVVASPQRVRRVRDPELFMGFVERVARC